jgi:hypothetical protein
MSEKKRFPLWTIVMVAVTVLGLAISSTLYLSAQSLTGRIDELFDTMKLFWQSQAAQDQVIVSMQINIQRLLDFESQFLFLQGKKGR